MGVTFLLDTHVVLWLLGSPARVASKVREQLADPVNNLLRVRGFRTGGRDQGAPGKLPSGRHLDSCWSSGSRTCARPSWA